MSTQEMTEVELEKKLTYTRWGMVVAGALAVIFIMISLVALGGFLMMRIVSAPVDESDFDRILWFNGLSATSTAAYIYAQCRHRELLSTK